MILPTPSRWLTITVEKKNVSNPLSIILNLADALLIHLKDHTPFSSWPSMSLTIALQLKICNKQEVYTQLQNNLL